MEKYITSEKRIWAFLVDCFFVILLNLLRNQLLCYIESTVLYQIVCFAFYFVLVIYFILPLYFYGQTLGKMLLKIKVVDVSETKNITFIQAVLRNPLISLTFLFSIPLIINVIFFNEINIFIKTISTLPENISFVWFIASLLTFWSNKKRRALHDYIAGTVVIKTDYLTNLPIEKIA
jgi:uncharacterized RDD family membrane protein YckC